MVRPPGAVSLARRVIQAPAPVRGRLLLVRHAHTGENAGRGVTVDRIRGWRDVPLDAAGKAEARAIGALFADAGVALIVTSDLQRAVVTARRIQQATGAPLVQTRELRPWNLGEFQGQPSQAVIPRIHAHYVQAHPDERVPQGESFHEFKARFFGALFPALKKLGSGATVVFVASYRNLKLTAAWVAAGGQGTGIDFREFMRDNLFPGAIFELIPYGDHTDGRLLTPGFAAPAPPGQGALS